MLTLVVFLLLNALRWRTLLLPVAKLPVLLLLRWQLIGYLANTVFPFRAGEVARVIFVSRASKAQPAAVVATIVVEKLCDGASLVAFLTLSLLLMAMPPWLVWLARVGAAAFGLGLVVLLVMAHWRHLPLPAWLGQKPLVARLEGLLRSALAAVPGPQALVVLLGQSLLLWSVDALNTGFVLHAFGLSLPAPAVLLVTAGLNLVQIIPAGPAAAGSYELAIVALLGALGIGAAPAQLAALGLRAAQYAPPVLCGIPALWLEGVTFADLKQSALDPGVAS
jgi:hypothetical protein